MLENGAVIVIEGRAHALAPPVDGGLGQALAERGVPYRRGEVIVAVDGEHATAVIEVIGELGLDYQITRNRAALMVLPAGITKGTGLATVLAEMNFSPHNTVAVGDAENDLSLFGIAEIGAAVADAVSSVRRNADIVLDKRTAPVSPSLTGPYLTGHNVGAQRVGGSTSEHSMTQPRPAYREAKAGFWLLDPPRREKATSSA